MPAAPRAAYIREIRYEPQTLGRGSVRDLYFWPKRSEKYIFMPDGENNQIRIYRRSDGAEVGSFGRGGHELGNFEWVHKIAIDSQGNVYAGEVGPVDADSTPEAAKLAASFLEHLRLHEHVALSTAVILYVDNAYGRSHLAAAEHIAAAAKLQAIAISYPTVITDAKPYIDRILRLKADVLLPVSFVTDPRKKPTPSLIPDPSRTAAAPFTAAHSRRRRGFRLAGIGTSARLARERHREHEHVECRQRAA